MPSTFTDGRAHLELPANGDDVDTWNAPLNADFTVIDQCISNATTVSVSNANVNLTRSQMQFATIQIQGVLTANVQVNFFAGVQGIFLVNNVTTGNFTLVMGTTNPGAGAVLPQTSGTFVVTDGTNVFIADTGCVRSVVGSLFVQPGMIADFAMSTAPSGWLVCDGSAVSRTGASAALFAAVGTTWGVGNGSTTFNVPDLRGQFRRGWDSGGAVDPARAFASLQADAFKAHNHGVNDPGHSHTVPVVAGVNQAGFNNSSPLGGGGVSVTTSTSTTGITIQNAGGSETRPTNYAVLTCIKT